VRIAASLAAGYPVSSLQLVTTAIRHRALS
jgi:hypothetical protein